jgi:hypothetical protein
MAGGRVNGMWQVDTSSIILDPPGFLYFLIGVTSTEDSTFYPLIEDHHVQLHLSDSCRAYDKNGRLNILDQRHVSFTGEIRIHLDNPAMDEEIIIIVNPLAPEWAIRRGLICPGVYIRWTPPTPP